MRIANKVEKTANGMDCDIPGAGDNRPGQNNKAIVVHLPRECGCIFEFERYDSTVGQLAIDDARRARK